MLQVKEFISHKESPPCLLTDIPPGKPVFTVWGCIQLPAQGPPCPFAPHQQHHWSSSSRQAPGPALLRAAARVMLRVILPPSFQSHKKV